MATKEKKEEGAQFVRYFGPLLNALRGLGGSAKAEEAVDRVAEDLSVPDSFRYAARPSLPGGKCRWLRWVERGARMQDQVGGALGAAA